MCRHRRSSLLSRVHRLWLLSLVLMSSWLVAFSAEAGEWTSLGPAPLSGASHSGRIAAIAPHPTDASVVYVGTASGGVWRRDDTGWTPLTDHLPFSAIGAVAVAPSEPTTIYAGTGEANYANHSFYGVGLYRSRDGGDTWDVLATDTFAGRTFSRIVVAQDDPLRLFAAVMHAGGFPARAAAKGHAQANDPVGVFRSLDGGETWTALTSGLPADVASSDLAIAPGDDDTLYAALGDPFGHAGNGVYRSTDGGESWTELGGGLPSGAGRISLAVAPSQGDRIYVMITNPSSSSGSGASTRGVYRSNDGGDTWSEHDPGAVQATYGWYLSTVGVDPGDPDRAYFGGVSLVRTSNGGSSFADVTPPHVDMHAVAFAADGSLLVGDDGGLHRSTNAGDSYTHLNDGLGAMQFYAGASVRPDDDQVFLGGLQDNGTVVRSSSGVWNAVLGGDGGYTALHPAAPDVMLGQSQNAGNVYRSTNGGQSFSAVSGISGSDRTAFFSPISFARDDAQLAYLGTHRVYRSTNGGASWSAVSGDVSGGSGAIRSLAVAPSDASVVYTVTNDGIVSVSRDGGASFDAVLDDVPGAPRVTKELAVSPLDADVVYLAVSQFGTEQVRRTSDGGQTWQALDADLPDVPVNTIAVASHESLDGEVVLLIGSDTGVFVSCDDGTSWHVLGDELPHVPVVDVAIEPQSDRFAIATMGRGAWTMPIGDLSAADSPCNDDGDDDDDDATGDDDDDDGDDDDAGDDDDDAGDDDDDAGDNDDDAGDDDDDDDNDDDGDDDDDDSAGETDGHVAEESNGCGCASAGGVVGGIPLLGAVAWRRRLRRLV